MRKTELIIVEEIADNIKNYLITVSDRYKQDIYLQLTASQNLEDALEDERERELFGVLVKQYEEILNP